jgi:hypothetical protein
MRRICLVTGKMTDGFSVNALSFSPEFVALVEKILGEEPDRADG